jgi:hypothetical protein
VYEAGRRVRQDYGAGPWVPGDYRGDYRLEMGHGSLEPGFIYSRDQDRLENLNVDVALFNAPGPWHNDDLQSSGVFGQFTGDTQCVAGCTQNYAHDAQRLGAQVPGDGVVRIVNETALHHSPTFTNPPELSTRTRTEWTVHTDLHPGERREQPGVVLDWFVDMSLANVVDRDEYDVTVTPGYSVAYTGDHGPFRVELWATYDDGATWEKVGTRSYVRTDREATFEVEDTPRRTNGFVGFRAVATDRAGNRIDQTVIRAARTVPAPGTGDGDGDDDDGDDDD